MRRYDYVVIGGGSAGCVAAGLLAEDRAVRVLLLECGPAAEENPETLRADGYKDAFRNDRLFLERFSEPQRSCRKRRLFLGTGHGIGGSGAINAMVYTRGAKEDYDEWPEGWRWSDVTRDFDALEARLHVRRREPTRFTEACLDAAEAAGFRRKEDLNDGQLGGVIGYEWMNYDGNERRHSYAAFLRDSPADVTTGAQVHRIVFDEARRAVAVEYEDTDGCHRVGVDCEVILSAGALESPKLLMLSGVGPKQGLRTHGIPVVAAVPRVGRNLHDHPNVCLFFKGREEVDCYHPQVYGFHRVGAAGGLADGQSDTCYVFYPARSSFPEATARMLPTLVLPQWAYRRRGAVNAVRRLTDAAFRRSSIKRFVSRLYGIVVILGKPLSRGTLWLRSASAKDPACIDPRYFEAPEDLQTMIEGVRFARQISGAPSLEKWGNRAWRPGRRVRSDQSIARWVKKNVMTTYHFAGTCSMGDQSSDVVDPRLRVRGVQGVRVADASVVPVTPVSAMNAPSMLIGYRVARFLGEERSR